MIELLLEYLKINTAQPHPDYASAIALFADRAQSNGFKTTEFELHSKNRVLVITLPGSNPAVPAVALNHHMDVVPAENIHEWVHPPFAGIMHDDLIIGRGTQDMKGVGIAHYAALLAIKKQYGQLERTIHLLMVPDEECGGFKGTKEFVAHPDFASLNIGYLVDEGMPSGNENEILLKVEERTPIQIRVTAKDLMGHASQLHHPNATHTLITFLNEIILFHANQKKQAPAGNPGIHFSSHITSLTTDNKALNVISSTASATIDLRVPAHCTMKIALDLFKSMAHKHPGITFEVVATSAERCLPAQNNGPFYTAISQAITDNGLKMKPFAFEATTDSRFYSAIGIEVIGITPFTVKANLHGTNESIRVKDLELAQKIFVSFLINFCKL